MERLYHFSLRDREVDWAVAFGPYCFDRRWEIAQRSNCALDDGLI